MKVFVILLLCLLSLAFGKNPLITEEFIKNINEKAVNWEAHANKGTYLDGASVDEIKILLGVKKGGPKLPKKTFITSFELPDTFSSITNWPECTSIGTIRDQSACGSCWAFGAVEAMSDRICIFQKKNVSLSAADLAFCCDSCGFGCGGGFPASAWQYYQNPGIVEEGCWAYPFPSCDHHIPNSPHPCPSQEYPNPNCQGSCSSSWDGPAWNSDLHIAKNVYSLSGETDILNEVYQNGPVEVAFTVYEDFVTYKSGVYRHTSGSELGGHAVKILGWGIENGDKYWLVANSWNPSWGDHGFFKILRGTNECGIEDEADAGMPQ